MLSRLGKILVIQLVIIAFFSHRALAQLDFQIDPSYCLNQGVAPALSGNTYQNVEWDFCVGSFGDALDVNSIGTIEDGNRILGIDFIEHSGTWYGVATSWGNSNIYLLTFANGLNNSPSTVTNLGNPDNVLNGPVSIRLIERGGFTYALIQNWNVSNLVKVKFEDGITGVSQTGSIVYGGYGGVRSKMEVIDNSSELKSAVINTDGTIQIIDFHNDINRVILSSDVSITSPISPANEARDIELIKVGTNWYGFVAFYSGVITRVDFGNDILNGVQGTHTTVATNIFNNGEVNNIEIISNAGDYELHTTTVEGDLFKIDLGTDVTIGGISSGSVQYGLGNSYAQGYALLFQRFQGEWYGFLMDDLSSELFSITKSTPCYSSISYSNSETPILTYSQSGTFTISLTGFNADGTSENISKVITISNFNAPQVDALTDGECLSSPIIFTGQDLNNTINVWSWDFGDGVGTSSLQNDNYSYASPGTYEIKLDVADINNCKNSIKKTIKIYNSPDALFTLPSGTICSNKNYIFTNTSTFDNGSNPTWQWNVNGTDMSTTQDLTYLIPSTVAQNIKLTASIPGCSTQSTQSITTVQDGPIVNFSTPSVSCVNAVASFVNSSTGTITSYNWDFGDGNTSSQINGANTYSSPGTFAVTLTANTAAGCQNFLTQNFPVYSNPQPDFVIEAPPFSCANYPAQFDNNTPPLSDSNITLWAWSFGDSTNGTSNQKNPSYTYTSAATYTVTLQATSNFGCSGSKQQSVIIYPSPQSGFTNSPACVNQNTQFMDASSGTIVAYQWVIQSTILTGANPPPYVFTSAGTFPVTLMTTSSNGCKNQAVKNITVPIPPVMDFIFQSPCTGNVTIFQELNPGGLDPSIAWNWNFGPGSGTGSPVSYSYAAAGMYSVTLSATRSSGCVYSTSKNITIYEGPEAKFTPSTQGGAAPLAVTFNNESNADSYFWQFGDTDNSTSSDFSPEFTYTQLGQYKALLTASNIHSCIDTVSTKIYVVIPHVDLAMDNLSLVENLNNNSLNPLVTILNLGNIPLTNPEVQIDLGGNALLKEKIISTILPGKSIQQTLSLEIVPQSLGYICAEVTSQGDVDIYNDRQCLSMTDNDVLFYPYPNPAKGQINFDWISSENEDVVVTIYKSTGQVAFNQNFQMVQSGINQLAIDISSLSSGLYLIQFSGSKTKKTFSVSVIN